MFHTVMYVIILAKNTYLFFFNHPHNVPLHTAFRKFENPFHSSYTNLLRCYHRTETKLIHAMHRPDIGRNPVLGNRFILQNG